MSLPVMAPGCDERGVQTAWDTVWMARCWINGCSKSIRSGTGLCDECIEELRYETNKEGG